MKGKKFEIYHKRKRLNLFLRLIGSIVDSSVFRCVILTLIARFPFTDLIEYLAWIRMNRREYTSYVVVENSCTATRFDCALESSQVSPFVFWG